MRKLFLAIATVSMLSFAAIAQGTNGAPIDSLSYALGINLGYSLKSIPIKVDVNSLSKAISEMLEGTASMTVDESGIFLQNYFMNQQAQTLAKNKEEGQAFLDKNKDMPGVITSPSGLQYKIDRVGTGPSPTENDKVEVHYRGTLLDGREFDSSYSRGEPMSFPLKGVIKGWTEGLQHAKEGGKITLYIPADLAYGDSNRSSMIEPGSTLIFEIELLKVFKQETQ